MAFVMMWLPFSRYISATPLIIRLSDSVAPLVKMISFGVAPISEATCARAFSTASSPAQPNEWLRLAALPQFSVKYVSIAFHPPRIDRRGRVIVHVNRQLHSHLFSP